MFKWAGKASKIPATTALLSKASHAGADVAERGRHGGGERLRIRKECKEEERGMNKWREGMWVEERRWRKRRAR